MIQCRKDCVYKINSAPLRSPSLNKLHLDANSVSSKLGCTFSARFITPSAKKCAGALGPRRPPLDPRALLSCILGDRHSHLHDKTLGL